MAFYPGMLRAKGFGILGSTISSPYREGGETKEFAASGHVSGL